MPLKEYYVSDYIILDSFPILAIKLNEMNTTNPEICFLKNRLNSLFNDEGYRPAIFLSEFVIIEDGYCQCESFPFYITRIINNGETHIITDRKDLINSIANNDLFKENRVIKLPDIDWSDVLWNLNPLYQRTL